MNDRKQKLEALFHAAAELDSPEQREIYLNRVCGGDAALRGEVETLLRAVERAGQFFDDPALAGTPLSSSTTLTNEVVPVPSANLTEGPGTVIGRYKLLQKIGEGGMGVVYMAEQTEPVTRKVALKIIKLGMDTRNVVARFEAERQALALMDHPNIARILDGGATESGRPYFVMELVRGVPITEYCDKNHLPTPQRLDLFTQVCHAIQHAHQKGIIHRDIKPSNILVTLNDGVPLPMVIDFGIAKATSQKLTEKTLFTNYAQMIGTPAYMSPEQAEMSKLDVDTRTDIYSLGVLLYELLTGTTPFPAKELLSMGYGEMQRVIAQQEPLRPSTRLSTMANEERTAVAKNRSIEASALGKVFRGDLDWIVMKCLEKDRARRYETANGLAADLKRHLNNEPVVARPPSAAYRFQKAWRRNKVTFTAATVVAAALVIGIGVSTWQAAVATRARNRAGLAEAAKAQEARIAQQERDRAERSELVARQKAYASDMNLVQQALAINNLGRAEELLQRHRPELEFAASPSLLAKDAEPPSTAGVAGSRTDLRGWEWRFLWRECQKDALKKPCQKTNAVGALVASADGKWLAVGEIGNAWISILDWRTRQEVASLPWGSFRPRLAFSPRGLLLAYCTTNDFATHDRAVRLWDGATRQVLPVELPLGVSWCKALIFSEDGQTLVTSTAEEITLWRIPEGKKLAVYAAPQPESWGTSFAVTRNLSLAAHGAPEGKIRVINLANGTERWISKALNDSVEALAFSQDGTLLASCDSDWGQSSIRLWDVATGKEIKQVGVINGFLAEMVFWPDGKSLAASGSEQAIRLWDLNDLSNVPAPRTLRGHKAELHSLALSPDNRILFSGDFDGSVYAWDTAAVRREHSRVTLPAAVVEWRFAPDSKSVVTVDKKGQVARWQGVDFQEMQPLTELGTNFVRKESRPLISEDGRLVAVGSTNGIVEIWDLQQPGLERPFNISTGEVSSVRFFEGGKRLVVVNGSDGSFHEWNLEAGRETRSWSGNARLDKRTFSADGRWYFECNYVGEYMLRDLAAGREIALPFHLRNVNNAGFSPDGKLLAVASDRPCTWLFEAETFRELTTLRGYLGGVKSAAFSPDVKRLATGSDGREAVKLWDVESHEDLLTLSGQGAGFESVAFSPDGNILGAKNVQDMLHLWRAPSWEEIAAAEAKEKAEGKQP